MKFFTLALVCFLACAACARPLTMLSDGQPGYAVNCDTLRERCLDEIALACRDEGFTIVSERAQEVSLPWNWPPPGPLNPGWSPSPGSRYWIEARCGQ